MFTQTGFYQSSEQNVNNVPISHYTHTPETQDDSLLLGYNQQQHISREENTSIPIHYHAYQNQPLHGNEMSRNESISQQHQSDVYSGSPEMWTPCESQMECQQMISGRQDMTKSYPCLTMSGQIHSEYHPFIQKPVFGDYTCPSLSSDNYSFQPTPHSSSNAFSSTIETQPIMMKLEPLSEPPVICGGFRQPCLSEYQMDATTKPPFSYITLIVSAMMAHNGKRATLNEIYSWIMFHFAYYQNNTKR